MSNKSKSTAKRPRRLLRRVVLVLVAVPLLLALGAAFLPQNVVPLMRGDVADNPQVKAALDPVQAALTTQELTALNKQVDVDRQDPDQVAGKWLKSKGLA